MKPCIFLLSPIGVDGALEADGTVLYFCSYSCRHLGLADITITHPDRTYKLGESEDWITGTVCEECHTPLSAGSAQR